MTKPVASKITTLMGRTSGRRVPVTIGDGCLDRLPELMAPTQRGLPLALVTDSTVDALCGERVVRLLRRAGWRVRRTVLRTGETIKSQTTIRHLHEDWFAERYDRSTPIVALGGGTVTDAVGFAAATFLRGLPLWLVPTTIVGQVDAAIGGKVGINHARGKNLIGAFYQPAGVVIDPTLLGGLSARDRRSGLAEVVKYGVITDAGLFRQCEKHLASWIDGTATIPGTVIARCVRIKQRVVAKDETDRGLRLILNFGHTLGHAFERWGGYRRLKHGEAVAMGMAAAGSMSHVRGLFSKAAYERLIVLCEELWPRHKLPAFTARDIVPHLKFDKKRRAGINRWVMPVALGRVVICDDISSQEVRAAVAFVRSRIIAGR